MDTDPPAEGPRAATAERLAALYEIVAALTDIGGVAEVGRVVVERLVPASGAAAASLYVPSPDGGALTLAASHGLPPGLAAAWRATAVDGPGAVSEAYRERMLVVLESAEEYARRYPALAAGRATAPYECVAVLPLVAQERCLGAAMLAWPAPRRLDGREIEFLLAVAGHCAQALDRVATREAERAARREAERAAERAAFLADAGHRLTATIDVPSALDVLARVGVEAPAGHDAFADYAVAQLFDDAGRAVDLAVAHRDPSREAPLRALMERWHADLPPNLRRAEVVATRHALLLADVDDDALRAIATGDEHLAALRALAPRSLVLAPMVARGRAFGILTLALTREGGRYVAADVTAASKLAAQGALAVDNARLYDRARRATAATGRLQALAAAFSRAVGPRDVAAVVLEDARVEAGAVAATVGLLEGGALAMLGLYGWGDLTHDRHPPLALDRRALITDALREGAVVAVGDRAAYAARYPELARLWADAGLGAGIAVPVTAGGRALGGITLAFTGPREFTPEDLGLYATVAGLCGQALERALVYHEAAAARAQAESASRAKDEFLALLGHELRNPIAPIATAIHVMDLRGPDVFRRERDVIRRQVGHLTRLVDDLLDVARVTRGRVALDRRPLEVALAVAQAIETASPLIEARRHRLTLDVPPRGLAVDADRERLAQVFGNLLANAAKYTEPGGSVAVRAAREGGDVVVSVRDDGAGIEPELLGRVFEPFVQAPQTIARSQGGLGLGLALVRSLVALHGGSVSARSDGPGRGSEFVVRLPAADAPPADERAPEAASPAPASRARVLVVDDNEDAAHMIAQALELAGYAVRVAHDGPEALARAAEAPPDVAVLDLGLPVMDGYELARELRRLPGLERLPLAALTGYGQPEDRARTRAAGFDAHLVKPVDLDALARTLASLAGG